MVATPVNGIKVLVSFTQIQTSLIGLEDIPWPPAYTQLWRFISILNFDLIPWSAATCAVAIDYYDQLLISSATPIALFVLSLPFPAYMNYRSKSDTSDNEDRRKKHRKRNLMWRRMVVWCFFLVFPTVTRNLLAYFHCKEVGGTSYLVSDFQQVCGSEVGR